MSRITLIYNGEVTDEDINVLSCYPEHAAEFILERGYTMRIEANNGKEVYASHYKGNQHKEEEYEGELDITKEQFIELVTKKLEQQKGN